MKEIADYKDSLYKLLGEILKKYSIVAVGNMWLGISPNQDGSNSFEVSLLNTVPTKAVHEFPEKHEGFAIYYKFNDQVRPQEHAPEEN